MIKTLSRLDITAKKEKNKDKIKNLSPFRKKKNANNKSNKEIKYGFKVLNVNMKGGDKNNTKIINEALFQVIFISLSKR